MMKKLVLLSILLAMMVIVLGAYARLTDAGLGCPDWPGCYGHLSLSKTTENIEIAQQASPDRPFEEHKAWNEMIHHYFASALGFLILVIFINNLFSKTYNKPVKLPLFLVFLVCFQGGL
jgi:cytochrome c oxidase assembly protein subunit 15